jgi:1-acylglycerone phosphate reductase
MANSKPAPKTVLITGCSNGGIGSALALEFQKRGHKIFAGVRSAEKASDLASLTNVTVLILDVTSQTSIQEAVKSVANTTDGKLDILINNAGHGAPSPITDANLEHARQMFDVNFWGTISMVQAFAKLVVASKGCIVNVCSLGAVTPTPYIGMYGATKAAVKMVTDTLRIEMKPFGVRVITAMVGLVKTKFGDNLTDVTLADDALFKSVEKWVNDTPGGQRGGMEHNKMPVEEFARRLVGDVLEGSNGLVYRGGLSSITRLLHWFFPVRVVVSSSITFILICPLTKGTGISVRPRRGIGNSWETKDCMILYRLLDQAEHA